MQEIESTVDIHLKYYIYIYKIIYYIIACI